jgi:hypothetical protein
MKKITVLFIVIVLSFALVVPALAQGKGPHAGGGNGIATGFTQQKSGGQFTMVGTITTIGTNTVTINVISGNKLAEPNKGSAVTVAVTAQTRYLFTNGLTTTTISFSDLNVGQPVSVSGTLVNNIWTASRITVGASLSCMSK